MSRGGFALLSHPAYLKHLAGPRHPERPQRLIAIAEALKASGVWDQATHLTPREATEEELALCHTPEHITQVREACASGRFLDPDTRACRESWEAARLAVGAGLTAADALVSGSVKRAFCLVRPPGHHAESQRSMGFCLFNNIAIAARYLQRRHGVKRIAIVDFDVHHGNGTQEIFYHEGSVMYCSTHQYGPNPLNPALPFYPGTGSEDEMGRDDGAYTTINVPMPPETGSDMFTWAYQEHIAPKLDQFKPEMLLISAGFDAHRDDPLASLNLSAEDFGALTGLLVDIANRNCQGRVLSLLEGGYHLQALAASATAHAKALAASASGSPSG